MVSKHSVARQGSETADGSGNQFSSVKRYVGASHDRNSLFNAGEGLRKVQALLGHRHITTTQIDDKRRRTTAGSASHEMPI
jgi:site-specific recombinase XerD